MCAPYAHLEAAFHHANISSVINSLHASVTESQKEWLATAPTARAGPVGHLSWAGSSRLSLGLLWLPLEGLKTEDWSVYTE